MKVHERILRGNIGYIPNWSSCFRSCPPALRSQPSNQSDLVKIKVRSCHSKFYSLHFSPNKSQCPCNGLKALYGLAPTALTWHSRSCSFLSRRTVYFVFVFAGFLSMLCTFLPLEGLGSTCSVWVLYWPTSSLPSMLCVQTCSNLTFSVRPTLAMKFNIANCPPLALISLPCSVLLVVSRALLRHFLKY